MPPPASLPPIDPKDEKPAIEGSGALSVVPIVVDIPSSPKLIVLSFDEEELEPEGDMEPEMGEEESQPELEEEIEPEMDRAD